MQIIFPDESRREYAEGVTGVEVAASLSGRLAKEAVAVRVGDELLDLMAPLADGAAVQFIKAEEADGLEVLRHSASHIMAQAVLRLFPGAKLAIGPAIDNGFYYDFDMERPLTPEDLTAIQAEMEKIIKENFSFERFEMSKAEALKYFREKGEIYKEELVEGLGDGTISFYRQGDFVDLCRGPHLPSTDRKSVV